MYVINSLYQYSSIWHKNGWKKTDDKPVKNQDLLVPLCEMFDANRQYVSIKHVKVLSMNHGRHFVNKNIVDVLAKKWSRRCARKK
jgi:ribonuclease HI